MVYIGTCGFLVVSEYVLRTSIAMIIFREDREMSKRTKSTILLFITAFIWGSAFVAQKMGGEIGAFTYNGIRTLLGGLVLVPLIVMSDRADSGAQSMTRQEKREEMKILLVAGILCGLTHFAASTFQQFGVAYTSASKSGFITSLYAVLIPIFSLVIGKKVRPIIWGSAVLSVAGLYLISLKGGQLTFQKGDILTLLCAVFFAFQLMLIGHYAPKVNGIKLSSIQFIISGILGVVCMFIFEHPQLSMILPAWKAIAYGGIMSTGVGYTLEILGQKHVPAAEASLILCLESVFSALTGIALLHEHLTTVELTGCGLIFIAVVLSQLPSKNSLARPDTSMKNEASNENRRNSAA